MPAGRGAPTLGVALAHDWTRRYFAHLPQEPAWEEHLDAPYTVASPTLEYLSRSREGLDGAVVAARPSRPRPGRRRWVLWHGRHRVLEEAMHGWFGARVQPVPSESIRVLLERLPYFFVADAATRPTFLVSLPHFVRLGVSHGVLESVLDARVLITAESLFARAAYVPSLRFFVDYDGARYAQSSRKLFYNHLGDAATVENVAREALQRLGFDAVHPAVFRRMFALLVGRPAAHFRSDAWPAAFLQGRLSPFEWVQRAQQRFQEARTRGLRPLLAEGIDELRRRPFYRDQPGPDDSLPAFGRYLSDQRLDDLLTTLGDERLLALLEGLLLGHDPTAADWFAWETGGRRAFLCEVKSQGDTLRPSQKEAILWCQRTGAAEYRLLEILHRHAQ